MGKLKIALLAVVLLANVVCLSEVAVADSLKDSIQARLNEVLSSQSESTDQILASNGETSFSEEEQDTLLAIEGEDTEAQNSTVHGLMQMEVRVVSAEEMKAQEDTLLQLASASEMSFDCFRRSETECEAIASGAKQMCVWKDNRCAISPAAIAMICEFYCEYSVCLQRLPSVSTEVKCVPKPSATFGLCAAINTMAGCQSQSGLCSWSKKGKCADAPSCCSTASQYCARKTRPNLNRAMRMCGNFTTASDICSFVSDRCSVSTTANVAL